jgi:hypothetical protein
LAPGVEHVAVCLPCHGHPIAVHALSSLGCMRRGIREILAL